MSKRLTKAQKQHNKAVRRQERLYNQYTNLLNQTVQVFFDNNLGKYGIGINEFIKSVGTSTGLKKPTKETIKKLKTIQSKEQVLAQANKIMLTKKFTAQNIANRKEIMERLEMERKYGQKINTGSTFTDKIIFECSENIRMFQQILDEVIYKMENEGKTSSENQKEVKRNAKRLMKDVGDFYGDNVQRIKDGIRTGDKKSMLDGVRSIKKLSDNITDYTEQNGTMEYTIFYDSSIDGFEGLIIPSFEDIVEYNDIEESPQEINPTDFGMVEF